MKNLERKEVKTGPQPLPVDEFKVMVDLEDTLVRVRQLPGKKKETVRERSGASKLLKKLKEAGYTVGLLTTASERKAKRILSQVPNLSQFLDEIHTQEDIETEGEKLLSSKWFSELDENHQQTADLLSNIVSGWSGGKYPQLFRSNKIVDDILGRFEEEYRKLKEFKFFSFNPEPSRGEKPDAWSDRVFEEIKAKTKSAS